MINAYWLLLLFPATWFGYILCALLSNNSESTGNHNQEKLGKNDKYSIAKKVWREYKENNNDIRFPYFDDYCDNYKELTENKYEYDPITDYSDFTGPR